MRYFSFLFAVLFVARQCEGQTFTKVFSSDDNQLLMGNVALINSGGWYASGISRKDNAINAFLTKFDVDGTLLWSKVPDESRETRALVSLNDGTSLFFNNNSGFQGYFDASVVRVSGNGDFISETIWGKTEDQDDWADAQKMDSGEVIAVGMSRLGSSFDERVFLVKFSATGQVVWEKTYGGGLLGRFREVIVLPSGEFYTLGQSQSFPIGETNGMIAKFTASGDLIWAKAYDFGSQFSYFLSGQALADGSLFVAAYLTDPNGLNIQLSLLNVNTAGAVTNQKTIKGVNDLGPFRMGQLNSDTLLIAAITTTNGPSTAEYDNIILQVSPQGDLLGTLTFGGSGQDYGYDAFFVDRQVVICGMTDTSADGSARRAYISKSGFNESCCEKNTTIEVVASPPFPLEKMITYTNSSVPSRQNRVVGLTDLVLSESLSCQNPDGSILLPPDTTICVGDTIQIQFISSLPGDVIWDTGATTRSIFVNAAGNYSVTLSGECGNASDAINVVSIGNRVTAQVEQVDDVCPGERVVLSASGGPTIIWYDENGMSVFNIPNPTITPLKSMDYTIVVADGQCRDTALVPVNVFTPPSISAGQDVTVRLGGQVRLSATGASAYSWLPQTGLSCNDCPSPFADPILTTTYILIGTDVNGCADTASVTVFVEQPCPYFIPNIFSPEGENGSENGRFGVFSNAIEPTGFLLRVYSRWGELVFESNQPELAWDGAFRDKPAPSGVYLYQLQMTTCDGPIQTKGDITLVR